MAKFLNAGDKVSSLLGAPPSSWKDYEQKQMKQIHRCYQNAQKAPRGSVSLEVGNKKGSPKDMPFANMGVSREEKDFGVFGTQDTGFAAEEDRLAPAPSAAPESGEGADLEVQRDLEGYLPRSSPLRSLNGDKKAPMNPTFKDYDAFVSSCGWEFWQDQFKGGNDVTLSQAASSIVHSICNLQSSKVLRVKKGAVPLRKRREQITPLALCLHELKLWCTNWLKTANIYDERTYMEINHRREYLKGLVNKEVWGNATNPLLFLGSGMHKTAHNKLYTLLLSVVKHLDKAYDYSMRGYNSRSSREKLFSARDRFKDVVFQQMKLLSGLFTLRAKLAEPGTKEFQPASLFIDLTHQTDIDYTNLVNVCFYKLLDDPIVRGALNGEFEKMSRSETMDNLTEWAKSNLFCQPENGVDSEPLYLFDPTPALKNIPQMYTPAANELRKKIKEVDPKRKLLPLKAKEHAKKLEECFGFDKENSHAVESVMKLLMKSMAAIQDVIPAIYLIDYLHKLSGDVGNYTLYDTLKEHVIDAMQDSVSKIEALETSTDKLLSIFKKLQLKKEDIMQKEAIKKGGAVKYKPAWVMNYKYLKNSSLGYLRESITRCKRILVEVAQDAWYYELTSDEINDKVQEAKSLVKRIVHGKDVEEEIEPEQKVVVDNQKRSKKEFEEHLKQNRSPDKDWLKTNNAVSEDVFGTNDNFGDNGQKRSNPFAYDNDDEPAPVNNGFNGYNSDSSNDV